MLKDKSLNKENNQEYYHKTNDKLNIIKYNLILIKQLSESVLIIDKNKN